MGLLKYLLCLLRPTAAHTDASDDYSGMSWNDVTRKMRDMGRLSQQPGKACGTG